MELWLIILLSVLLGLLLLLVVLPVLIGVLYRTCTRKCPGTQRLDGKTVIVTGATAGIGKQTALSMARRGARLILACRNKKKADGVAEEIIKLSGNQSVVVMVLDLSDLTSVRAFAAQFNEQEGALHVLINNAGITMDGPKQTSPQGFELIMATNHYGCFLLTHLLINKLKASSPSRIVTVSSDGHKLNELDLEDLNYDRRSHGPIKAYCQSKLCNVLFTKELARRLEGSGVTSNCLHPGFVASDIFSPQDSAFGRFSDIAAKVTGRNTVQGAQTNIFLAVSEKVEGKSGYYYSNCKRETTYRKSADMKLARKLWDASVRDVVLTEQEMVI